MIKRQQLKIWLQFARALPVRLLAVLVPYRLGHSILHGVACNSLARRWLFARQIRWIENTQSELSLRDNAEEQLIHSLAANYMRFYRLAALARTTEQTAQKWLQINDLNVLQQAIKQERGVILVNSHTSLAHLLTFALHRLGYSQLHTIGDISMKLNLLHLPISATASKVSNKQSRFLQQLQEAKLALRNGGLVQIAADGSYGNSGIKAEFFGRERFFRNGFAELAVTTEAEIIPAQVTMKPDGQMVVTFLQPLCRNASKKPHHLEVADLMAQYIELNRQLWSEHLGDLKWRQLQRFLALPKWENPKP